MTSRDHLMKATMHIIDMVYENHAAGGGLRIVLDDENVTNKDIKFCISSNNLTPYENICAKLLLFLTEKERLVVCHNWPDIAN